MIDFATYKRALARRAHLLTTDGKPERDTAERGTRKQAAVLEVVRRLELNLGSFNFVHVTGTSGKGSVCKLIHDILLADSKKVGTLVTPYTTTYLESFLVGQGLIDSETLVANLTKVLDAAEALQEPVSTGIAVALQVFKARQLDWAVIEVGRGGRFDATNVIPSPKIAVITNVDHDHRVTLGETLEEIAWQKAGIIKKGCHVICGERRPELQKIFIDEAQNVGATIEFVAWHDDYQKHNKAIARAVGRALGINSAVIDEAISTSRPLPCRFETIQKNPRVIIDGAHNPAKIRATVNRIAKEKTGRCIVLFGCKSSKNPSELLLPIIELGATINTTCYEFGAGKSTNPHELIQKIPAAQRGIAYDKPQEALRHVLATLTSKDILLVTGSLYLAGELRAHWVTEEQIFNRHSAFNS